MQIPTANKLLRSPGSSRPDRAWSTPEHAPEAGPGPSTNSARRSPPSTEPPSPTRSWRKPNITFIKHDAFTLKPADLGPQDWVCSDVICYPERLLEWVNLWLDSGLCKNFICTIKMQGKADHAITKVFADIPGSHIVHLTANKHELTWIRMG